MQQGLSDGARVGGAANSEVARACEIVVASVPYQGAAALLGELRAALAGRVVISTASPLQFVEGTPVPLAVEQGSAAEEVAAICPEARVVGAFHTVSASSLQRLDRELDEDVLLTGDDSLAKQAVKRLVAAIPKLRPVDAGGLAASRYTEGLTPWLLQLNRLHHARTGVRVTGI